MCIGDGQVQAGLLNRGMGICCSRAVTSLMEGALPSVLWQPERFRSKREAAKACMAACVSMALHRWIRALVREWGLVGFGVGQETEKCRCFIAPTSSSFNPEDNEAASPIPEEFGQSVFLVPPRRPRMRVTSSREWGNKGGVNR